MRILIVSILIVIVGGTVGVYAQPPLPKALLLDHIDEAYPPGHTDAGTPYYVQDTLYPIGWSRDGKLAYLKHDLASELSGEHYCLFQIIDLNTDSIVYNLEKRTESTERFWVEIQDSLWSILERLPDWFTIGSRSSLATPSTSNWRQLFRCSS